MSEKESVDSATAQSFAERLLTILNDGALCLMISVGLKKSCFTANAASITFATRTGHIECQSNFNKYDELSSAFRTHCSISSQRAQIRPL